MRRSKSCTRGTDEKYCKETGVLIKKEEKRKNKMKKEIVRMYLEAR